MVMYKQLCRKINNNTVEQSTTQRDSPKRKQRKRKWGGKVPPNTSARTATSKMRIIDFDREESSNWNETCLNNNLNVSFLAFQITRTVKPDFFLLASSQRTFYVQGLVKGGKKIVKFSLFRGDCWAQPGSRLSKIIYWCLFPDLVICELPL